MAAKKKVEEKPKHPLMLNGQSWDRKAVMDIVCAHIATSSRSIVSILAEGHEGNTLPTYAAIKEWLQQEPELVAQYARAKEDQADLVFEEILQIADTPQIGVKTKIDDTGKSEETRGDMIEHRRLRVDARKWYLSKLAPKKYGDKVNLEHTGPDGGAVKVEISDTERARRIAFALQRGLMAKENQK